MSAAANLIRYLISQGYLEDDSRLPSFHGLRTAVLRELEERKLCNEAEALAFLGERLFMDVVDIEQMVTHASWLPDEFIETASADTCWQFHCLPYRRSKHGIHIITANPLDDEAHQMFEFIFQETVIFELAPDEQIVRFLQKESPQTVTTYDSFVESESAGSVEIINPEKGKGSGSEKIDAPPIVKLCNKIITDAIEHEASDIHLEPTELGLDVRFRIHGSMQQIFQIPKRLQQYVTTRFKILSGMDISERRRPQDGRARARINGEPTDIRVSSVPTAHGEKLVLRLLSRGAYNKTFNTLGIPEDITSKLIRDLTRRGKMILVTGPTGSGKSTTLYTGLQYLQDGSLNIETVEDPIEYRIKGINQIQVNEAAGVTFASTLRSILRQDPDVIMIGEIRDLETASIAMQAAQTGHLVLSTLHTNDAISTIQRLIQLGCAEYLVASSVAGIMAQRLVRTLCPDCTEPLSGKELAQAQERASSLLLPFEASELQQAKGCDSCNGTGFRGRTGLYSYLEVTPAIESLINEKANNHVIAKKAAEFGFRDLRDEAITLLQEKRTTLEEVLPYLQISTEESAAPVESSPSTTPTQAPVTIAVADGGKIAKTKILLVEDDEGVRSVLSLLLEKEMFDVIEAANGLEALEHVYEHNPHVILCDLMMPIMDGRDFLLRMKKNAKTAHIPILMLTAADDEANEIDLLELGAADFVSKASSSNVMLTRIRRLLGSK